MPKKNDAGLAAIARSTRKMPEIKSKLGRSSTQAQDDKKPPLKLEGRRQKTSVALDVGIINCLDDTAHTITIQTRISGRGRIGMSQVLEAAFIVFHELPFEKQIELVRKSVR